MSQSINWTPSRGSCAVVLQNRPAEARLQFVTYKVSSVCAQSRVTAAISVNTNNYKIKASIKVSTLPGNSLRADHRSVTLTENTQNTSTASTFKF